MNEPKQEPDLALDNLKLRQEILRERLRSMLLMRSHIDQILPYLEDDIAALALEIKARQQNLGKIT